MKKSKRYWMRLILLLIMIGLIGFALYQVIETGKPNRPQVGDLAPDFQLTTLAGEQVSLKQLRGKAVVLNFWGSWCEPCRTEMPALNEIHRRYQTEGITVIGINIAETDVAAMQFVKQYQLAFPIWMDRDREVVNLYQIGSIPSTYFIDPEGRIAYVKEGPLLLSELEKIILSLKPQS